MTMRKVTSSAKSWLSQQQSVPSVSREPSATASQPSVLQCRWLQLAAHCIPPAVARTGQPPPNPGRESSGQVALLCLWVQQHIPLSFVLNLQEDLESSMSAV